MSRFVKVILAAVLVTSSVALRAETITDIEYAQVNAGIRLKLDIHKPDNATAPLPVVIWLHKGGWFEGDKSDCPAARLTQRGFAVVSVNYRFSHQAIFPAQLHDIKGAIRWIRANAATYNFDPLHIGVWGESSGGHLAALTGTSGDVAALEGDVGGNLEHSSRVQATCDFYGPTDFTLLPDADQEQAPASKLIGAKVSENPGLAQNANPITYVTGEDAPFLIVHGEVDQVVPFQQSQLLFDALRNVNVSVLFHVVTGAGHAVSTPEIDEQVNKFFDKHLKLSISNPDPTDPTDPNNPGPGPAPAPGPGPGPAPTPGGSVGDVDGDGIFDAYEILAGTDPKDPNSKPIVAGALSIDKVAIKLDFKKSNNDSIQANMKLTLPEGYSNGGTQVNLLIGGLLDRLTLDSKGSSPKSNTTAKMRSKKSKGSTVAAGTLQYTRKKSAIQSSLADTGMTARPVKGETINLPIAVALKSGTNAYLYVGEANVLYKATVGKSGQAAGRRK